MTPIIHFLSAPQVTALECIHVIWGLVLKQLKVRGDCHMKRPGVLLGNFEKKNLKRYQDPVLWAWLEIFFTLERYQF